MKGVDLEMDSLSLQSFAGGSTQIPSSVNYSWNKKQINRRLVIGRRVVHSPNKIWELFFYICIPPAHDSPTECDKLSIMNKMQLLYW